MELQGSYKASVNNHVGSIPTLPIFIKESYLQHKENEMNKKLKSAMMWLEQIPQGNIGKQGATQHEIHEAEKLGHNVYDDATYHCVQQAWLILQSILEPTSE